MKYLNVMSSAIKGVAYDKEHHSLFVKFNHGGIYKYEQVNEDTFIKFVEADSVGKFYNENIKKVYKGASHEDTDR